MDQPLILIGSDIFLQHAGDGGDAHLKLLRQFDGGRCRAAVGANNLLLFLL
jgi:hypothetical protein